MVISARRFSKRGGPGFTLLELLLTVALLVALLAAVVFNFAPLKTGASLEEGGRQFEALIRFAAAQAAQSGRVVQFRFDETKGDSGSRTNESSDASTGSSSSAGSNLSSSSGSETTAPLRVMREVDPVGQPGVWEEMPEAQPFLAELLERIHIEDVKGAERPVNLGTNDLAAATETVSLSKPPITFYPDGSSDTADIILSSRDPDDFRQMKIHLAGVTGTITSRIKMMDPFAPIEWMDQEKTPDEIAATGTEQGRTDTTTSTAATDSSATPPARNEISDEMEQALKQQTISTNGFPDEDFP